MFSKNNIIDRNSTHYSQYKTRLDLSFYLLFLKPHEHFQIKNKFSFSDEDEDDISMDEAILMEYKLQSIPSWITHLNLNNNELGERTMEELVIIFEAIPKHIQHISLKANVLFYSGFNRINRDINDTQAFSNIADALSKNYLSVNLDNNWLGNMNINKLNYLVSTISPCLETLKLRFNQLGNFSDKHLIGFFKKLPSKLKYLYLKGNELFKNRAISVLLIFLIHCRIH